MGFSPSRNILPLKTNLNQDKIEKWSPRSLKVHSGGKLAFFWRKKLTFLDSNLHLLHLEFLGSDYQVSGSISIMAILIF